MRYETPESKYMAKYFTVSDPLLEQLKSRLQNEDLDFMSVSPVEARYLQFFVSSFQVKTIVEIGSLIGYSALAMAMKLPADGKIYCFEKEKARAQQISQNFAMAALKCSHEVFSGEALPALNGIEKDGPFDLVFIDANKNGYLEYLDWAEANTKSGSIIIGDNTFLFGALWGDSRSQNVSEKQINTMNQFNERIADSRKYDSIMIPTLEGMTIGRRI